MVQWKGNLDYNQVGAKAKHLDQVNSFNVPNFFTVTQSEVKQMLPEDREPENIRNTQLNGEVSENISEAYNNIGVASEIRNASGKAKNLVGNRRESSRVSIRISTSREGSYCRLNVGSSGLEKAVTELVAEYFEDHEEIPAIIVQKMVEPGHTGAIITDYRPGYTLIESVKGLGVPLEQGTTEPEMYLLRDEQVVDNRLPDKQLEVTRHPVNGKDRKRKVDRTDSPYQKRKILKAASRAEDADKNLKYVYKRGTFYIVDAEPAEKGIGTGEEDLDLIKAAGNPSLDEEFLKAQDLSSVPANPQKTVISKKGAYSSTLSQRARVTDLDLGVSPRESFMSERKEERQEQDSVHHYNPFNSREQKGTGTGSWRTASVELLTLNQGKDSLRTRPPFKGRYNIVSEPRDSNDISEQDVLTSYSEVFSHESDTAVLDSRLVPREGLEEAIEYIQAENRILIASEVDRNLIRSLIVADFDALAIDSQNLSQVEELVELEERRLILNKIRDL